MPSIDLAPMHKLGFVTTSPVLLAAGIVGAGDTIMPGMVPKRLGGVVVGPIRRHPNAGSSPPRLAERGSTLLLDVGAQNRGITAILKRYTRTWSRLDTPIIVHLADTEPRFIATVAERLSTIDCVSALELALPPTMPDLDAADRWLQQALHQLAERSDLPIWVKLPLQDAKYLGQTAVEHGAVGLVVGQPPVGALSVQHSYLSRPTRSSNTALTNPPDNFSDNLSDKPASNPTPSLLRGTLYGPSVFPLMLAALVEVVQLELPVALIACGGIHTVEDAKQLLALGANAIQIDSAAWIEPGLPQRIDAALRNGEEAASN